MRLTTKLALATLVALPACASAQTFNYAIVQPQSSLTYAIEFEAPFLTTPANSSYFVGAAAGPDAIIGTADDTASPPATRTIPGLFGGNTATNQYVNLTGGGITAEGTSGTTVIRPSGSFSAAFNVAGGSVAITNLTSSLLGGGTASIDASASISYTSFRTREPSCTLPSIGAITVPVGSIVATAITAEQTGPSTGGTLTAVAGQPGRYVMSAGVPVRITVTATLNGAPAPLDPQLVTLTVSGEVDLNLPTAPMSAQISVDESQTELTPLAMDPLPFNEVPLCAGASLLVKLTLASTTTGINLTAALAATGTAVSVGCGPADIGVAGGLNGSDGELDNNDFIAFINYFFASNPLADRGVAGGLPGTDGLYDNNDFIVFINQFFAGC